MPSVAPSGCATSSAGSASVPPSSPRCSGPGGTTCVHHGNTNNGDARPRQLRHRPPLREEARAWRSSPPSPPARARWYSYLFLAYSFTFHAQLVLWMQAKHRREFKGMNRTLHIWQSVRLRGGLGGDRSGRRLAVPLRHHHPLGALQLHRPELHPHQPLPAAHGTHQQPGRQLHEPQGVGPGRPRVLPLQPPRGAPPVPPHAVDARPRGCARGWRRTWGTATCVPPTSPPCEMLYRTPRVFKDANTL